MSDTQILSLALIFAATLGSIMYNNSRITDVGSRISDLRTDTNTKISDLRTDINKRFDDVNRHIDDKFDRLSDQMKHMEENLMRILGDHESRIQALEGKKNG